MIIIIIIMFFFYYFHLYMNQHIPQRSSEKKNSIWMKRVNLGEKINKINKQALED